MLQTISDIFRDIYKYLFISLGDERCACLMCYTADIKDSVVGWKMVHLKKSFKGFLLFVIHDNYLLQWYYTDIWCILKLNFNSLVIFTKDSIRAVSTWPRCQYLCLCRIPICFCLKSCFCAYLRRVQADYVVSYTINISFLFMNFHLQLKTL